LLRRAQRRYPEVAVMAENLVTGQIPIVTGSDGVIRVASTRVTLDAIVAAFQEGATAEEIAQQYSSVSLADVYQVIGYYLRHSSELQSYLTGRRGQANETRRINEERWSPDGVRERLLARRPV
jgi:uncharacterized protein (DUF433 family)